jgi:hypothetical protein
MNFIDSDAFIVTSGPPEKGKYERISQVRSHITRRYFQQQNQRAPHLPKNAHDATTTTLCLHPKTDSLRRAIKPTLSLTLPPEIAYTILAADHPMLDSGHLMTETTRRMQKCKSDLRMFMKGNCPFWKLGRCPLPDSSNLLGVPLVNTFYLQVLDVHMRLQINGHPFLRNVIKWSITYPQFTSTKLLNASGWDDIQESGQLSPWTRRQHVIAIKILNESVKEGNHAMHNDATVAAILSLLGFEVRVLICVSNITKGDDQILNGRGENYLYLRKFSRSIVDRGVQWDKDIQTLLTSFFFLLDQTNRLCMASVNPGKPPIVRNLSSTQFLFPVDFVLFTFGDRCPSEDNTQIHSLLVDFYSILSIAEASRDPLVAATTHDYMAYQRQLSYQHIFLDDIQGINHRIEENTMSAPIHLCIFLLGSYLLSGSHIYEASSLAQIASKIRTHFSSTSIGLAYTTACIPFPGALLWCYAVGVRFAGPEDKTWFLMQFLRVSHWGFLEKREQACKSLLLVVNALENVYPLCLAGV